MQKFRQSVAIAGIPRACWLSWKEIANREAVFKIKKRTEISVLVNVYIISISDYTIPSKYLN
ncbi:protein of unknown function [Shewanella benthica]|uniref:Uncharacterized protein n=1 Tax=Shewanella benthica TaxID=43661 RepID=A0A330M4C9_9GAMM|nr:protein of unknown function [Shewanella benthica]